MPRSSSPRSNLGSAGPSGVLVDGLEANGTQSAHASQLANAYALAFGLVPAAQVRAVADYVVKLRNSIGVSTYGNLLNALHDAGRDDALVASLTDPSRPGYAQMLREGATYGWESWDARQTGDSESHAFGSNVLTIMQEDLLGVTVSAPGAGRIDVRAPAVTPMRASGVVVTQRGRVPIAWDRPAPGRFSLDVTVPDNVVAEIHVPARLATDVSDGHAGLAGDPGVTAIRSRGGEIVLTAGSGSYHLRVPALAPLPAHRSSGTGAVIAVIAAVVLAAIAAVTVRRRRRRPAGA